MKKIIAGLVLLAAGTVCAELPIPKTEFNKVSLELVERSAGEGNPEAQFELALRYYAGHQVVKNETVSFEWMSKSAGQKHPGALALLSQMYAEGIGVSADS
ncbi:MAG: hypothetical protein MUC65_10040, partial [Pontiellaceae bacterium]|nr:hypothetical protein [Pontiellaceae bacterium]